MVTSNRVGLVLLGCVAVGLRALWWQRPAATRERWPWFVAAFTVVTLAVRAVFIPFSDGTDLHIYYFFSHLVHDGANPYHAVMAGGAGIVGDEPPFEFQAFSWLLAIHDSPQTLQWLFALADVGVVLLVGLAFQRSFEWRANFMLFYAISPFVLRAWVNLPEDKSIMLLLIAATMCLVERDRVVWSWVTTSLLAALKWAGLFFVAPLLEHTDRVRSRRTVVACALLFIVVVAVANSFFWPDNLVAFDRRNARNEFPRPIFESITILVDKVGLYTVWIPKLAIPIGVAGVFLLHWLRKITTSEAIALGIVAGFLLLPDEGADRILLIAMSVVLVTQASNRRWLLWGATSVVSGVWVYGPAKLHWLIGDYGTVRHLLGANLFMLTVLGSFAWDKLHAAPPRRSPAARPTYAGRAAA